MLFASWRGLLFSNVRNPSGYLRPNLPLKHEDIFPWGGRCCTTLQHLLFTFFQFNPLLTPDYYTPPLMLIKVCPFAVGILSSRGGSKTGGVDLGGRVSRCVPDARQIYGAVKTTTLDEGGPHFR